MDSSIKDSIDLWLQIIIAALILFFFVTLVNLQQQFARHQQAEIDAIEQVREYRMWSSYDGTRVNVQDVSTLIIRSKGSPEVWVDTNPAADVDFTLKWVKGSLPELFTATQISTLLPAQAEYTSTLVHDDNGGVIRIEFRRNP